MKVACIRVSTDLLIGKKSDFITNYLAKKFLGIGVVFQNLILTQNNPENIFSALKFLEADTIVIVGEATSSKNYSIKKAIATHFNVALERNEESVTAVANYYKQENSPIFVESENEYYLPAGCVHLTSKQSHMQGFILKLQDKTIIFLPDDITFVQSIYETNLKTLLQDFNAIQYKTYVIKTFGIYEKDIYSILGDLVKNIYKILFITYPSELEVTLVIRYNETLDSEIVRGIIAKVYERLNKYIYADDDVTLAGRAIELMKLNHKTLAVAEAVSGGSIANTLMRSDSDDANPFLITAVVCPDVESKIRLLGAHKNVLEEYGQVSVEAAYEMAAGLLESSGANYVLCTTGNNQSTKPNEKKVTYIAVGNQDGIHVYKNTFIGTKENVMDNITQTSLFYLIKNIKQNDLIFNDSVV